MILINLAFGAAAIVPAPATAPREARRGNRRLRERDKRTDSAAGIAGNGLVA